MGKMMRSEGNIIRPRRSTGWGSDSLKTRKGPIFKIDENEFAVNLPPSTLSYNYYYNNASSTKKRGGPEKSTEIKTSFWTQLEKYCENTTLHGLRYVGDSHLSFGERIFWFISFSLAIGFAAYYISNIYTKWKSSPVIISFSPFDADLSSIPFPAITICNMNQAKKNEALKILKEGSDEEKKLLDDACNGNATFNNSENISWESLRDFLVRVGNSCSDILKHCQWGSDKVPCGEIFNNDLTDEGLCCSFNRLPPEKIFRNWKEISILNQTYSTNVYDWNAERGFVEPDTGDSIPKRPLGAGAHLGLSVVLDAQVDNYYCSSTRSTGFKMILSNPIETPKMADFGFLVSPGFESRISIEPSVREASSSLRSVPIEKRQCYFANERPLQYYRKYTQKNCRIECEAKSSLLRCGCIPYYTPNNGSKRLCDLNDKCHARTLEILDKSDEKKIIRGKRVNCQCLSSCFGVTYAGSKTYATLRTLGNKAYSETYLRGYSQKNCLQECLSNFTLKECGCIPYYLPQSPSANDCEKSDDKCIARVKQDVDDLKNGSFLDGDCSCKPACFETKFNSHYTCTPLNVAALLRDNITYKHPDESYTQRNCMLECQSNHTFKRCKCVPYYLPKSRSIKYCGKTEKECVENAKEDMEVASGNGSSCHCLSACFFVKYTSSRSVAKLARADYEGLAESTQYYVDNMAVMHFFFYNSQFTKELKSELFGFTEILSNIGGLLSLCLGFSFLSLIELVYFVTLRLFCDIARHTVKRPKKTKETPVFQFSR